MLQIHLSTAIALVLVAGAIIGANTVQYKVRFVSVQADQWYYKAAMGRKTVLPRNVGSLVQPVTLHETGWPVKFRSAPPQLKNYSVEVKPFEVDSYIADYAQELIALKKYPDALIPFDAFVRLAPTISSEKVLGNGEPGPPPSAWAAPIPYAIVSKNAAVGLVILIGVATLFEWVLRRRREVRAP